MTRDEGNETAILEYFGRLSTNSSSDSGKSTSQVCKPPSEFGDSSLHSEPECDEKSHGRNQYKNSRKQQKMTEKIRDLDARLTTTDSTEEEDSTLISNQIYELQGNIDDISVTSDVR